MTREDEIIRLWGGVKEFSEELQAFLTLHEKADLRTFDDQRCLVSVTYVFRPYLVWQDNRELREALKEQHETKKEN